MKNLGKTCLCLALSLCLAASAGLALAETFEVGSGSVHGARCRVRAMGQGNQIQFRNIRHYCYKRKSHIHVQGFNGAGQAVPGATLDTWLDNCPNDPNQYQFTWNVPGNLNVFEFQFNSSKGLVKVHINNTKDCWHP